METEKSKVEIVSLYSELLARTVEYCAILPENYENSEEEFSVLYLLHGLFGRFDSWVTNTKITEYARDLPFVIICPEGANGWYTDNEERENHFYESYIFEELIPDAEHRFKIRSEASSRAVAGLSMGGYGAFKFAFRRPEMFCFAASLSGAFHAAEIRAASADKIWEELFPSISEAFGDTDEERRDANDLFKITERFPGKLINRLPYFYFDCGAEDSFLPVNHLLAEIFRQRGIPHEFHVFPGGHDWDYWDARVKHLLDLATAKFIA